MAAWLHHGNNLPRELNCLTSLGRSTSHIGNKTKLSSLSFDRQLKFRITAWPKLGNKAAENGNKSIKCTGSYYTAVKVSSEEAVEEGDGDGDEDDDEEVEEEDDDDDDDDDRVTHITRSIITWYKSNDKCRYKMNSLWTVWCLCPFPILP